MNFARRALGVLALLLLAGILAGVPAVLWWVTQPFLPALPNLAQILGAFTARDDGTLIAVVLLIVSWLAWAYLAVALLVEIWAAIRRVPTPRMPGFSLPQVAAKRLVGAAMLAFIAAPAIAGTATADDTPPAPAPIATTTAHPINTSTQPSEEQTAAVERTVTRHTVGPKDSLYSLAATYLGDGDRWPEIFNDNKGIVQANGSRLSDPDLIIDGTELTITIETPAPQQVVAANNRTTAHTVGPKDSLYSLAATYLGDGDRWPEIFNDNKGIVQANGSRLSDPNLIIDGTELTITLDAADAAEARVETNPTAAPSVEAPKAEVAPEPEPVNEVPAAGQPITKPAVPENPALIQPQQAPSSTEQPSEARPVIDYVDEEDNDEANTVGIRAAIGVGALAASGVVGLIASRRFFQRRQRARGAQLAMPEGHAATVERELRAVQNPLAIAEVDLALRSLAKHCRNTGTALPDIRAARLTGTTFEIYTVEPEQLPDPWIGTASGMLWSYHANDTDQLDRATLSEIPAPYPALVCLGQDLEDAHILADLETVGSINIDGPHGQAEEILAAMAIELATSSWADDLTVTIVGAFPEMEDILKTGRIRYLPTAGRLFDELVARADNDRLAMQLDDATDLHHARVTATAPSTWFPEVIMLSQPLTQLQQDQLDRLLNELPRVAVASIAIGQSAAEWTINMRDPNHVTLEPLGLAIIPQRITTEGYRRVLEIVDVTNNAQPIHNETSPVIIDTLVDDATNWLNTHNSADETAAPPHPEAAPESAPLDDSVVSSSFVFGPTDGVPFLRVLGTVEVEGADGVVEPNRAGRLTEYLAYLVLTSDTITARTIDDAIWPNRKKENNATTRDPATSRLRKWLGTKEDGQLRLDVNTFQLSGVDCDWHQFEAATRGPLNKIPTEQLAGAIGLVRGTPFKSTAVKNLYYSWAEPCQQQMISRVVDVCYELALRQLVDEEWLACEKTLATGIDIEPGDEQLWRMRILAAHARHNQAAVDEAISRLFAQLEGFDCQPEPETIAFLHRLGEGATVTDLMEMI